MASGSRDLSVGIIGAGPGGLALGIFLRKAGFRDFTIFDREDGVGGTWRINTYPGLACDVKSHLYSYSFDLNSEWSRLWSGQQEILRYFERSAERYKLGPNLKLNTEIVSAHWDSEDSTWLLTTAEGQQHRFDIVVSAIGLFTRPVMPNLVEEEPFVGTLMHSARWDHSVDLTDERVAVLGTGSTAAQVLPELAKVAAKVYSIQRSPTWILPKPDREYTDRERWIFAHIPFAKKFYRTRLWLRSESNISVIENGSDKTQEFKAIAQSLLDRTVADEELRRKLTPEHPLGCKRLVFSSDFIPALTRENVEVISSPARALRSRSLITEDGNELDVDVVVCATGYAAADYLGQIDVVGEGGISLRDKWSDGAYAYLGMAVPDFPNFFMLYGPNTNVGSNSVIFMLEAQANYVVRALKYMRRRRRRYVAVRPESMADFIAKIDQWMEGTVWTTRCSNYFRAANGRVVTQWPRSARVFWGMVRRFKAADYSFEAPKQRRAIAVEMLHRLDPALRRFAAARADLSVETLGVVRESLNQRRADAAAALDTQGVDVTDTVFGRVPVRIYRGASTVPAPAVLYCHSGAFVLGNLDTDHFQCVEFARGGRCTVISVDYRLAPEDPYPAGFDDACAVLEWVVANAGELHIDPDWLAVAGNSAGGALAARLAQCAAGGEAPALAFQLLHQPVLDDRQTPSKDEFTETPGFDGPAAEQMWRHYAGDAVVPVGAVPSRSDELAGVAKTLITCSELDPLRDEAIDYALRLMWSGVAVELHVLPGTCHGFDSLLPQWETTKQLIGLQTAALRRALHPEG